jgi:hypothetical protein
VSINIRRNSRWPKYRNFRHSLRYSFEFFVTLSLQNFTLFPLRYGSVTSPCFCVFFFRSACHLKSYVIFNVFQEKLNRITVNHRITFYNIVRYEILNKKGVTFKKPHNICRFQTKKPLRYHLSAKKAEKKIQKFYEMEPKFPF